MHMHSDASKAASDVCTMKDVKPKRSLERSPDVMKYEMLKSVTTLQVICRSVMTHVLCVAEVCLLLSTFCIAICVYKARAHGLRKLCTAAQGLALMKARPATAMPAPAPASQ